MEVCYVRGNISVEGQRLLIYFPCLYDLLYTRIFYYINLPSISILSITMALSSAVNTGNAKDMQAKFVVLNSKVPDDFADCSN